MKLKMTVDDAIVFAHEWSRGMTINEGSQGWRVVCMVLADAVHELRSELDVLLNRINESPIAELLDVSNKPDGSSRWTYVFVDSVIASRSSLADKRIRLLVDGG